MMCLVKTPEHNIHIDIAAECIMVFRLFRTLSVKIPDERSGKIILTRSPTVTIFVFRNMEEIP